MTYSYNARWNDEVYRVLALVEERGRETEVSCAYVRTMQEASNCYDFFAECLNMFGHDVPIGRVIMVEYGYTNDGECVFMCEWRRQEYTYRPFGVHYRHGRVAEMGPHVRA